MSTVRELNGDITLQSLKDLKDTLLKDVAEGQSPILHIGDVHQVTTPLIEFIVAINEHNKTAALKIDCDFISTETEKEVSRFGLYLPDLD